MVVLRIRKDRTAHDSRSAPLPKPVFLWHAMQNDIDIFRGIKSEIQKNPENFKPAGQWLGDFCQNIVSQEEQYIKKLPQTESNTLREIDKKKNLLKKIHKEKKTLTGKIAPYTHNDKKYKKEKKQLAELFCEANQLALEIKKLAGKLEHIKVKSQEKPGFIQLMPKAFEEASCEYPRDCRKFMLIAWLLTDKYLSESKLGITKYEKYVFRHEIIVEDNGRKRLVSEQELAKDAVFARPDAMEIIRDAWNHIAVPKPREDNFSLSDEDQRVLEELAGNHGTTLTIRTISKTLNEPHSTIRDRVVRLMKKGLAAKAEGRQGYFSTNIGKKWYDEHWEK